MFQFVIELDGNQFHAYCPELPGCHTFGTTKEEALENLKEAVLLYLEDEIEEKSMQALLNASETHITHA